MIRALLWDNDGVLVDTEPLYLQANRELLASIGIALSDAEFAELSLRQGRSVFELASAAGHDPDAVEALRRARNARYSELLARGVAPMPGVRKTLAQLHGRLPMAIVTSSNPEHFEQIHVHTELLPFFEFAITPRDYTRFKPHPEPYQRAVERLGLDPGECLAIEDSERGLQAARAAGVPCAVVPHALSAPGDFAGAAAVLDGVHALADWLAQRALR